MTRLTDLNPHVRGSLEALIAILKAHGCEAQLQSDSDGGLLQCGCESPVQCGNLCAIVEGLRLDPSIRASESVPNDWLHVFCRYAVDIENAGTQAVWSGLLAAAMAEPRSVFKRALWTLYHLEEWELDAFRAYCAFAFSFESGMPLFIEHADVLMDQRRYLLGEDNSAHFQSIGLLHETIEAVNLTKAKGLTLCYRETRYRVDCDGHQVSEAGSDAVPTLCYRRLTAVGRQLLRALPLSPRYGFARNTIALLVRQGFPLVLTVDRAQD